MVRTLPDFYNPPAVETAVGTRFAPIAGWNAFHYGLLLQEFQEQYTVHELRPPLGSVTFEFSSQEGSFAGTPLRCWFISEERAELIQVQNDCFIRNWRKTEDPPDYLHYDVIRPRFQRDWSKFRAFLEKNNLGSPDVWQCEVSYINQFVRGIEWRDFDNLNELYPVWSKGRRTPLLARPQMAAFATAYALPNERGTLQFVSQPGVRKSDGAEIIQLTVTALGRPNSSDESGIMEWLDLGRAAVVQGFTDFTGDKAHSIWEKNDSNARDKFID
jgi:uncharacterized protein (TIGR04255 family)